MNLNFVVSIEVCLYSFAFLSKVHVSDSLDWVDTKRQICVIF